MVHLTVGHGVLAYLVAEGADESDSICPTTLDPWTHGFSRILLVNPWIHGFTRVFDWGGPHRDLSVCRLRGYVRRGAEAVVAYDAGRAARRSGCGSADWIGLSRSPWFSAAWQFLIESAIFRVVHRTLAHVVSEDVDDWPQLSM